VNGRQAASLPAHRGELPQARPPPPTPPTPTPPTTTTHPTSFHHYHHAPPRPHPWSPLCIPLPHKPWKTDRPQGLQQLPTSCA
jgi:hypothetical protein